MSELALRRSLAAIPEANRLRSASRDGLRAAEGVQRSVGEERGRRGCVEVLGRPWEGMRWLLSVAVCLLAACSGAGVGETCGSPSGCRADLVCWEWPCVDGERCRRTCEQPCESSEECPAGRTCSGMLCARVGASRDAGRDTGTEDASAGADAAGGPDADGT